MKFPTSQKLKGFSLIETVIAIGVVAVLLSGFLIVFAPAAAGIKDSINSKSAARLVNTLEQELVTLRGEEADPASDFGTGFDKAFEFILSSHGPAPDPANAILVYKYRASLTDLRDGEDEDGTPVPVSNIEGLVAGEDYVVRNMMRRKGDPLFTEEDVNAIEGPVYVVKCTQLVRQATGELLPGNPGEMVSIADDDTRSNVTDPADYNHAVIAFVADFYSLPSRSASYFENNFDTLFPKLTRPAFSRNLAVRR